MLGAGYDVDFSAAITGASSTIRPIISTFYSPCSLTEYLRKRRLVGIAVGGNSPRAAHGDLSDDHGRPLREEAQLSVSTQADIERSRERLRGCFARSNDSGHHHWRDLLGLVHPDGGIGGSGRLCPCSVRFLVPGTAPGGCPQSRCGDNAADGTHCADLRGGQHLRMADAAVGYPRCILPT